MKIPMPAVPVSELLTETMPPGAFVVCGGGDIRVSWARTVKPTSLESATADDFILIDVESLSDNKETERDLAWVITQLVNGRVRALGLQGNISVTALETAARNGLTVVYLPPDTPIETTERAICRYISELQSQLEKQDAAFQQELARTANTSAGLQNVMKLLAQQTDLPVVLHDAQLFRLAHGFPDTTFDNASRWHQQWQLLNDRDLVAHFANQSTVYHHNANIAESDQALSVTISIDNNVVGYLSVLKIKASRPPSFAPIALLRGATIMGLLLSQGNLIQQERYPRTDWISAWLEGAPNDDPILSARAEQHAFLPDQVYAIGVLRWHPGNDPRRTGKHVKTEQVTEQTRHETLARRINAIIGQHRDRTILFLPLEKAQHTGRMRQYMLIISERLQEVFGGLVICGVGRPAVGLTDLRQSFIEAERAMSLSEQVGGEANTYFFGDLSLNELIMNIQDYNQLMAFCQNWLSHILDYDRQNNSDLLLTMSVYFANNGNMAATAKQLNVHRNTLVYRLNRIAEITQLDMDDADVQLNLHLAIKAYSLIRQLGLL